MSGGCYQSSPRGKEGRCIRGHNAAYRHDEATEAEGEQAKEGKCEMPSMIYINYVCRRIGSDNWQWSKKEKWKRKENPQETLCNQLK